MLTTLKSYGNKNSKFSFILSFSNENEGATLSVFGGGEGVTVDLTPEDVKALSNAASEAHYANPDSF
ncbi:hypothetical protein AB0L74_10455 [Streptomyces sp. NPDC052020]|uniref:hypothetical protein n=1 Tax=Streptomyces sp. NPDC052020 TaxID=3155677 RepID=UPI00342DF701